VETRRRGATLASESSPRIRFDVLGQRRRGVASVTAASRTRTKNGNSELVRARPDVLAHSNGDGPHVLETEQAVLSTLPSATPRVSVVIPTLNEAANLPHVLGSLPTNIYELVLVDGRSTDETVEVARNLYPSVRIVAQTGRGQGTRSGAALKLAAVTSSSCSTRTDLKTPEKFLALSTP